MGSGYVAVPPDSTGKKIDCVSVSAVGSIVVYRQAVVIADPAASAGYATVTAGALQVQVKNASIAVSGQVSVTGSVAISNNINVSAMPAVVLAAGTANIGSINNISANVNVVLQAGTNNIGTVQAISAPVSIAAGTNNIGAVSNAAGTALMGAVSLAAGTANIGFINGISAPVALAAGTQHIGEVNISIMPAVNISAMPNVVLAAGSNNIGFINGISQTVNVAGTFTIGTIDKISATAVAVISGAYDSSSGSTTTVRVGDSANNALRVNVVAGGAGGGIVTGPVAPGASVTAGNNPVLMGGTDGTNARVLKVDTGGALFVNLTSTVIIAGSIFVTGCSLVAGTNVAINNAINISTFPALVAGTANIGAVSLAAGTAHIGEVNISVFPALVAGTANIGAVSLAAGTANIGSINNISAVVSVNIAAQSAGNILAVQGAVGANASVTAGNSPVLYGGRVKTSISTTATAHAAVFAWFDKAGHQIVQMNAASLHPGATHGPKSVTLSASANTVLVASAGTACVFVDSLLVTSNLAAVTRCDIYETASSAAPEVSTYLAIGGGGFTQKFDPPWVLSAGQALSARLKPSASAQVIVMVHFHVGPA